MRHGIFACSFSAILLLSNAAAANGWQTYSPPDGKFSVSFPAAPEIDTDGRRASASPSEHETYIVEYTELGGPKEDLAFKMFAMADKSFTEGGGAIIALDVLTVAGHPAEDVKIRTKEGFVAWDRLIAVNDRVYQLLHISDAGDATPDQFWDSFSLAP